MPILKLADAQLVERRGEEADQQFEGMLKQLGDSKWNWQTKLLTRTLIPVSTDSDPKFGARGARQYHKNYIEYLTTCWSLHYSIVIEPNHIWYTLLCELALRVKADPETYRPIFTDSAEKKTIIVPYDGGGFTISLDLLMNELRKEVPTDTAAFFPNFTTNTHRNRLAKYAAFAEMASPYYNYMMLACAFPAIDVQGTRDDWKLMAATWENLATKFTPLAEWFARVQKILDNCVEGLANAEWWKGMFANERCGSGSQVIISGWFADLFYEKCDLPKPENFPSCVATVDYIRVNLHDVDNVMNFKMKHGLFFSSERDEFLVPDFGHFLFNVADEPQTFAPEMRKTKWSGEEWVARLEPENMVNSTKSFTKAREAVAETKATAPEKLGPYKNAE